MSEPELPPDLAEDIQRIYAEGNDLLERKQFELALLKFTSAWEMLPKPRTERWPEALRLSAAIGDAHFLNGDFEAGWKAFQLALKCCGATDDPFLRLRLGQCFFEFGHRSEAANWLAGAYLLDGTKLFAEDDPKYLEFIKSQLEPPPGGWPAGW